MKFLQWIVLMAMTPALFAQIDGANVFGSDQVITFELTFSDPNYWDSLTTYYTTTQQYMAADIKITDNTGVRNYANVGVRLKGNSSYSHPGNKKSFKIDFNEYVIGQNYDGLKKLNFSNGFKDPSFIREKIFSDICIKAGVPAPRANYANVYINTTHWGFYTLVEQIDDQFLDWAILDDDGNLFKAGDNFKGSNGEADLKYYGTSQTDYTDRYELKTNETLDDWSDLITLIDFINNTTDTEFAADLGSRIEKTQFLRSIALDNLFSNLDSYINSARNYYIYHNLTSGKWEWIKWDGNEAFGNYGGGSGTGDLTQLAPNYIATDRPLVERVFDDSNLYTEYLIQLCSLMDVWFNTGTIYPMIDSLEALINSYVYADGNKMYSDADFDTNIDSDINGGPGPGGGQIYGLKSFVSRRFTYLNNLIDCSNYTFVDPAQQGHGISIFPNLTHGLLTIDIGSINEENTIIKVYDSIGRVVVSIIPEEDHIIIDLTQFSYGLYFVELVNSDSRIIQKVIYCK